MDEPQGPPSTAFDLVCSRLRDFFAERAPWQRRLWSIGTVLGLRELLEYADDCLAGRASNTEGLRFVVGTARREVGRDPGVAHLATELDGMLNRLEVRPLKDLSQDVCDELDHLAHRAQDDYLSQWVGTPADAPVELTARAIASHLLDTGFSSTHLYRWLQSKRSSLSDPRELAEEAAGMVAEMRRRLFSVFVPCSAPYAKPSAASGAVTWLEGRAAAGWLREKVPEAESRRHSGGFLIVVEQRDPWAAVNAARSLVARADARAKVARLNDEGIRMNGWARVAGSQHSFDVSHPVSQVEIGSLDRQASVYRFDGIFPPATDDALELASYMQSPSTGAAIIGGWSAIEGLLVRPGEGQHYLAADRLAALVACSLPRAELTPLAHRHKRAPDDALSNELETADTNYAKVQLVASHLTSGKRLELEDGSDIAAQNRIIDILADPSGQLGRIRGYVTESLRRLYNQRNLIAHSGSFRSAVLTATARTSFSLVGAGLDRIVHAQLQADRALSPTQLAARAETELRMVGGPGGRSPISLLD